MQRKIWFHHDSDASSDEKLEALAIEYGFCGVGRYWNLIEYLRGQDRYSLWLNERTPIVLAKRWNTPVEPCSPTYAMAFLEALVTRYQLLKRESGEVWSESLRRRMKDYEDYIDGKRNAGKASAATRVRLWGNSIPRGARNTPEQRSEDDRTVVIEAEPNSVRTPPKNRGREGRKGEGSSKPSPPYSDTGLVLRGQPASTAPLALTAAALAGGQPQTAREVLGALKAVASDPLYTEADETPLAAIAAGAPVSDIIAAFRVFREVRGARPLRWFLAEFSKWRARASISSSAPPTSTSPPQPDQDQRRAEREQEEREHPELVEEAAKKAAELKAKILADAKHAPVDPDDWDEETADAVVGGSP